MNSKLKKCLPFIIVVALELISLIFYNEEHSFLQMKCIGILAMGGFKFAIPMLIFNMRLLCLCICWHIIMW